MKRFQGELVCKAHRRVYHSTLGSRVKELKKYRRLTSRLAARYLICRLNRLHRGARGWNSGFRVWGVSLKPTLPGGRVQNLQFRVQGVGCRVFGVRFGCPGFGIRDSGFGIRDSGFGIRDSGTHLSAASTVCPPPILPCPNFPPQTQAGLWDCCGSRTSRSRNSEARRLTPPSAALPAARPAECGNNALIYFHLSIYLSIYLYV